MKLIRVLMLTASMVTLPLVAQQGTGKLKVHATPGRAGVFIDGKYVGPAANFRVARTYQVAAGEHEIKLVDPRYEEFTTKVTIEQGKTAKVRETLKPVAAAKPPFGRLRVIHADKFAAVYINGKYYGHVDEFSNFAQGVLVKPGEYEVKVEPVSGQGFVKKISVQENQIAVVKAD
ncbi:MAG TPA: PEGA domain-containing protein [Bryobacteraceae bacterium]|nr:PEGA domain-containing protein [Bryobacteraceae bacterium]